MRFSETMKTKISQSELSRRLNRPLTQIQRAVKTNLVVPDQSSANLILFDVARIPEIEKTIADHESKNKNAN